MTRMHVSGSQRVKSVANISDRTKRHHKQLNLFDINIKLA